MNNCIQTLVGAPDMVAGLVPCKAPGTYFTHEKPKVNTVQAVSSVHKIKMNSTGKEGDII